MLYTYFFGSCFRNDSGFFMFEFNQVKLLWRLLLFTLFSSEGSLFMVIFRVVEIITYYCYS